LVRASRALRRLDGILKEHLVESPSGRTDIASCSALSRGTGPCRRAVSCWSGQGSCGELADCRSECAPPAGVQSSDKLLFCGQILRIGRMEQQTDRLSFTDEEALAFHATPKPAKSPSSHKPWLAARFKSGLFPGRRAVIAENPDALTIHCQAIWWVITNGTAILARDWTLASKP